MQLTRFGDMACSIARTLEVAGEPWSPLIIRDVWVGLTRFDEIQRDLGISRKVLTERLKWLVPQDVLERRVLGATAAPRVLAHAEGMGARRHPARDQRLGRPLDGR